LALFVRLEDSIKDAILTIMKYISVTTGVEPTQEEIAEMLQSYFILNEIGNQVRYQLNKQSENEKEDQTAIKNPVWRLNLKSGPGKNVLARAGLFQKSILDAIQTTNDFMVKNIGSEPSDEILSKSLKSSFILSEIKNQIDWQRKNAKKNNPGKNKSQA
jgi:hypothetical protein